MSPGDYLLDNRADDAGKRFDALPAIFNPVTTRYLETLGVLGRRGRRTLGTRWLAARIGPTGYVLATDIDIGWITGDLRMADSLHPGGWLLIEDFDGTLQPLACVDGQRRRSRPMRTSRSHCPLAQPWTERTSAPRHPSSQRGADRAVQRTSGYAGT